MLRACYSRVTALLSAVLVLLFVPAPATVGLWVLAALGAYWLCRVAWISVMVVGATVMVVREAGEVGVGVIRAMGPGTLEDLVAILDGIAPRSAEALREATGRGQG